MAEDAREWQYDVDEVGDDAEEAATDRTPIEPESVDIENAVFVAVGALATVLVFVVATL
jgi:hypothetical protein